jgi:hypothetical protein
MPRNCIQIVDAAQIALANEKALVIPARRRRQASTGSAARRRKTLSMVAFMSLRIDSLGFHGHFRLQLANRHPFCISRRASTVHAAVNEKIPDGREHATLRHAVARLMAGHWRTPFGGRARATLH